MRKSQGFISQNCLSFFIYLSSPVNHFYLLLLEYDRSLLVAYACYTWKTLFYPIACISQSKNIDGRGSQKRGSEKKPTVWRMNVYEYSWPRLPWLETALRKTVYGISECLQTKGVKILPLMILKIIIQNDTKDNAASLGFINKSITSLPFSVPEIDAKESSNTPTSETHETHVNL